MLAGDGGEWDFLPLPLQACETVWEEVWEYQEGDKRWFAAENWRHARRSREETLVGARWEWIGGWKVCAAGGVNNQGERTRQG